MLRTWTIQVKADFANKAKNEAINQMCIVKTQELHAALAFLVDGQKPKVACFSDDLFYGHKELDWSCANVDEAPK